MADVTVEPGNSLEVEYAVENFGDEIDTQDVRLLTNAYQQPTSGVSRWTYDDPDDTSTAIDVWSGLDATIDGCTYVTDSAVGSNALISDGIDDRLTVSNNDLFDIGSGESLSASIWIKTTSSTSQGVVINKGDSSGGVHDVWDIIANGDGTFRFSYQDSSSSLTIDTSALDDGEYHHLVGVYEQGTGLTGYVDGTEVGSQTGNIGGWNNSLPLVIGGAVLSSDGASSSTGWYEGIHDDPRIYNKALTASEVSNLYNNDSIN